MQGKYRLNDMQSEYDFDLVELDQVSFIFFLFKKINYQFKL